MFAFGFGFLALFSVLSILLGNEDPRRDAILETTFGSGCATASAEPESRLA